MAAITKNKVDEIDEAYKNVLKNLTDARNELSQAEFCFASECHILAGAQKTFNNAKNLHNDAADKAKESNDSLTKAIQEASPSLDIRTLFSKST